MAYSLQLTVEEMAACTLTREKYGMFLTERLELSVTQTETYTSSFETKGKLQV